MALNSYAFIGEGQGNFAFSPAFLWLFKYVFYLASVWIPDNGKPFPLL